MNVSRLLISVVMAASLLSALNLGTAEETEGYSDVGFIQSLEDLLRSQAGLLSSFEFLMHQTPTNLTDTLMFLDSFEDLLRRQAVLFDGFESMLKLKWCRMEKEDPGCSDRAYRKLRGSAQEAGLSSAPLQAASQRGLE